MSLFNQNIINWYSLNKRDLPWRHSKNAYQIWLSEVILQQPRVEQGLPYYHSILNAFPRVEDLAAAEENKLMELWQGLGYYSRARNMQKCAKIVSYYYFRFWCLIWFCE